MRAIRVYTTTFRYSEYYGTSTSTASVRTVVNAPRIRCKVKSHSTCNGTFSTGSHIYPCLFPPFLSPRWLPLPGWCSTNYGVGVSSFLLPVLPRPTIFFKKTGDELRNAQEAHALRPRRAKAVQAMFQITTKRLSGGGLQIFVLDPYPFLLRSLGENAARNKVPRAKIRIPH